MHGLPIAGQSSGAYGSGSNSSAHVPGNSSTTASANGSGHGHGHARSSSMLSEAYIQDAFHSYLKSSLTQAKAEKLIDVDVLASAEGDLMITGPALCLYFAALRCTTNPPSVPLPRNTKTTGGPPSAGVPMELSYENCPPAFISFLRVWSNTVPSIQGLAPEHQHDLARVICGLEPLSLPVSAADDINGFGDTIDGTEAEIGRIISGIAADLRAVAIEISQRRSFQDRYASDLQAALDAGTTPGASGATLSPKKASFVPPPLYDPSPSPIPSSPGHSPHPSVESFPQSSPARYSYQAPPSHPISPNRTGFNTNAPLPPLPPRAVNTQLPPLPSPPPAHAAVPMPVPMPAPAPGSSQRHYRNPSATSISSTTSTRSTGSNPTILTPDTPAISFIRETLYASLADQLEVNSSLRLLLHSNPPRAYFAAVAFAILDVATNSVEGDGSVVGVLGRRLGLAECPDSYKPLLIELARIGADAKRMEREDTEAAIRLLQSSSESSSEDPLIPDARLDRVKDMLREGVGYERGLRDMDAGRRSVEGRAVAFANRINGLALNMTRLPAFRERQDLVFRVLSGVGQ